MRLLNLWPHGGRVSTSPAKRLLGEAIFAALCALTVLFAAYMYVQWRTQSAQSVQAQLQALQVVEQNKPERLPNVDYAAVRAQQSGQLNWLVYLPQWVSDNAKLVRVQHKNGDLSIQGRAQSALDAQQLFERIQQTFPDRTTRLVSLERKATAWWFDVQIGGK